MTDDTNLSERDVLAAQLRTEIDRVKRARPSYERLPAHPSARALLDLDRKLAAAERALMLLDSTAMQNALTNLHGIHDYADSIR